MADEKREKAKKALYALKNNEYLWANYGDFLNNTYHKWYDILSYSLHYINSQNEIITNSKNFKDDLELYINTVFPIADFFVKKFNESVRDEVSSRIINSILENFINAITVYMKIQAASLVKFKNKKSNKFADFVIEMNNSYKFCSLCMKKVLSLSVADRKIIDLINDRNNKEFYLDIGTVEHAIEEISSKISPLLPLKK